MIVGIGSDIIEIARVERILNRHADRFLNRVFTPHEITYAKEKANMAATLANRFAAKEATVKALGTGISQGIFWHDIEVINTPFGQPTVHVTQRAAEILNSMIPQGLQAKIFCTLSHSDHYAQAVVVIEAISC